MSVNHSSLPDAAEQAVRKIGAADIVIGIPSYNNAKTIGHVVRAAQAGVAKYFRHAKALIVNSDGGSTDGTRDVVLASPADDTHLLFLSTPLHAVHRLSVPYHGIPGKGSAFRLVFRVAQRLGARACAVVDSDLRSITPEWIDLLLRPVVFAGFDFVAPYYHRHKYDGTITNSIVYPLTRALYGLRVRQPIGGDFGVSSGLFSRYLQRNDWETDTARYGIDIWMTTIAIAEGFRVCQSFLGAKLHDAKDPGADLSDMLRQVVGSVFFLMQEYEQRWKQSNGSRDVDLFGFQYGVGLDPIAVNVGRMLGSFRAGCDQLQEVWGIALPPDTLTCILGLAQEAARNPGSFQMDDELWARIVIDFAVACRRRPLERSLLLRSLTPLYLARVASFVLETKDLTSDEVEQKVEGLCAVFERQISYLRSRWDDPSHSVTPVKVEPATAPRPDVSGAEKEVISYD